MAVVLRIKIPEQTGELIRAISQFQKQGHMPKMRRKEQVENSNVQLVTFEFASDAQTIQPIAEGLGYEIVDLSSVGSGSEASSAIGEVAIDLSALRTRYISALGPIGGTLFDETMEALEDELGTPEGKQQLIDRLTEQIDDEDEAIRFRRYASGGS